MEGKWAEFIIKSVIIFFEDSRRIASCQLLCGDDHKMFFAHM